MWKLLLCMAVVSAVRADIPGHYFQPHGDRFGLPPYYQGWNWIQKDLEELNSPEQFLNLYRPVPTQRTIEKEILLYRPVPTQRAIEQKILRQYRPVPTQRT